MFVDGTGRTVQAKIEAEVCIALFFFYSLFINSFILQVHDGTRSVHRLIVSGKEMYDGLDRITESFLTTTGT